MSNEPFQGKVETKTQPLPSLRATAKSGHSGWRSKPVIRKQLHWDQEKTARLVKMARELAWWNGILKDTNLSSSPTLTHGTFAVFKQQHEKLGKGLENGKQALITKPC